MSKNEIKWSIHIFPFVHSIQVVPFSQFSAMLVRKNSWHEEASIETKTEGRAVWLLFMYRG